MILPLRLTIALACASVFCCLTARPAASITGSEVIERMQKRFAKSKTYSARFEQRFYWAILDKKVTRKGAIYTRRPSEFRLEIDDGLVVVGDGSAIWHYEPDNEQVLVSSYSKESPTPWEILVEHSEQFSPVAVKEVELEGRPCYEVIMAPKSVSDPLAGNGGVEGMRVWVDKKRWHLLMVEETEANEDVTTYVLSRHRVNDEIADDRFVFTPTIEVDVIDRRTPASPDRPQEQ